MTSAGYYPDPGRRSPADAVAAARAFGVDLTKHRSRVLVGKTIEDADAIFVFDEHNRRAVLAANPSLSERLHFLGALSDDGPLTIADPFGTTARAYERTYGQIAAAIAAVEGKRPPST